MKCIVIGANGYIGFQLTQYLVMQHCDVVALVPFGFNFEHVKKLPVRCIEFSFDNLHQVELSACQNADVVYNMVWVGVNANDRNRAELQAANMLYNIRVVDFVANHSIKKLIIPGSAAQYACSHRVIDGTGEFAPSDLYAAAKNAVYEYLKMLCTQKQIGLIWTLITSIYGPGRDDNNLISYAIKCLLKGECPSFTRLEQQWDYLYVEDLMKALFLLGVRGKGGKVYPVGSGEHRQMREYVQIIRDSINSKLPLGIGEKPYKNSVIDNQIIDISELIKDTGFQAAWKFEKGIKETIEWFKKQ